MNASTQFLYTLGNLSQHSVSLTQVIIVLILGIVGIAFLRFFFQYMAGVFLVHGDKRVLEEKKRVLGDLILMKDIQTELEHEIEQASLKATFQR